jgi:hypothetical protein
MSAYKTIRDNLMHASAFYLAAVRGCGLLKDVDLRCIVLRVLAEKKKTVLVSEVKTDLLRSSPSPIPEEPSLEGLGQLSESEAREEQSEKEEGVVATQRTEVQLQRVPADVSFFDFLRHN